MTTELPQPLPEGELRVSHAEREAVVERLQEAAAEGRLDFVELDARLGSALSAVTRADLAPLTADLPPAPPPDPGPPLVLEGGLLGAAQKGRWQVPAQVTVRGGAAGAVLDFSQAVCRLPEVQVEVHGEWGGVTVVVPEGWAVDTSAVAPDYSGLTDRTTRERLPGTPLLRLTGGCDAAGVVVRHPSARERRRQARDASG